MSEPMYYTLWGLGGFVWVVFGVTLVLDHRENPPTLFGRQVPRWVGFLQALLWPVIVALEVIGFLVLSVVGARRRPPR